jgi:PAS domain S-box-containing protein
MSSGDPQIRNASSTSEPGGAVRLKSSGSRWTQSLPYASAVIATAAALVLYLVLLTHVANQTAPIVFLFPIALSAYWGGLGPGLLSTVLSVLAADYFGAPPIHSFRVENPADIVRLTALFLVGLMISTLSESLHRARRRYEPQAQSASTFALERKVQIGFAIGLLAVVLVGAMSFRSVSHMRDDVEWVDHTHQVISALREFRAAISVAETNHRALVFSGDQVFIGPYNAAMQDVDRHLRDVRALTSDNPAQQKHIDVLDSLVAERIAYFHEVSELRRTQGLDAAKALIATGRGGAIRDSIRAMVSDMENLENGYITERQFRAQRSTDTARAFIIAASALAVGFFVLGLFLIGQDFSGARRAEAELRELTAQLEIRVKDRTAELILANASLKASEELQSVTLASIGDGVITTDGEGRVRFLNAEAERLTGWSVSDALEEKLVTVFRIVNEETRAVAMDPAARVLETGKSAAMANRTILVARNGTEIAIADSASPIADAQGSVLGVVIVFRDCTAQRQAEKALREQAALQEQLAKVAAASPGAICSYQQWPDGRSCFPYASPAIEKIFGISPKDLKRDGSQVFNGMHRDDVETVRKTVADSATNLTPYRGEFRVAGPDGTFRWISSHSMPQRQADGSTLWHGVLEDITDKKLQEQKLQVSEDHFRMLVTGVKDYAIYMLDANGNIATWNLGAERIKGWRAEEVLGQNFSLFYGKDDVADGKPQRELRIARLEGRFEEEGWRFRKDGSRFWASVVITPLRDDSGHEYGFAKITRDMSERRRIEQAIKEDEARLAGVIGSAMDAIITTDEQQQITLFNPAAENMFGYRSSDVIGRPLDQLIPQRFREAHAAHIRKFGETHVTRRKMSQMTPIYGLRGNGEEFPIEASISHVEVGGQKLFTVILRDITERIKAEEDSREQSSILNLSTFLVRDMESRILLWTRGAELLYGYPSQEAIGHVSHTLLQTIFPAPLERIEEILNRDGAWEGELIHRRRDGSHVSVASKWVLHLNAQGQPIKIIEMNQDITTLKKTQAMQLASQKLESVGALSGGIAHDFNNILLAINGNAKLAISDLPADHPAQESLNEIAKAGARAADLVRRILTFTRPGEQKREVQRMQPVVEEAIKLVRATLPANIEIRTQFPAGLPPVSVDATQIHQVIVNLATNGAHAIGDRQGIVELRLDTSVVGPNDIERVPGLVPGRYVKLYVGDNGCGMDSATIARIYDPFFTTKPVGQGTGLGLSVVHGIISSHDGAVTVYSEVGKGTAFHLYFPVASQPETQGTPEPKQVERNRNEHVIYVDDEEALVFFATRMLTRLGYRVTGYTDAVEALQEIRAHPEGVDAVVTDLSMPRMSGLDLAREALAIRPDLTVVITSGYMRPEDQTKAEKLGVRDVILKPTTANQLATKLDKLMQERVEARMQKE